MTSAAMPPPEANNPYQIVPIGIRVGFRSNSAQPERFHPQQPLQQKPNRKRPIVDSNDESEPDNSVYSSDGLPPDSYKRSMMPRVVNNVRAIRPSLMNMRNDGSGNSMKELTRAILKFGEAYEQAETAKLQ
ncbi:hypothetical protein SASPL_154224 [Salvia splendens]|uniref:Uncharacterized protein n=1 Tax=Salvia splendens TaxID=180675 RepID=A0A8X8VZZ2_SALSN|nr:hypothetical protein SASPL_154224 [Salvia splendens]